ncbi:MAG: hypothetical protein ACOC5E_00115 [Acidobacteriota bacterium]
MTLIGLLAELGDLEIVCERTDATLAAAVLAMPDGRQVRPSGACPRKWCSTSRTG